MKMFKLVFVINFAAIVIFTAGVSPTTTTETFDKTCRKSAGSVLRQHVKELCFELNDDAEECTARTCIKHLTDTDQQTVATTPITTTPITTTPDPITTSPTPTTVACVSAPTTYMFIIISILSVVVLLSLLLNIYQFKSQSHPPPAENGLINDGNNFELQN